MPSGNRIIDEVTHAAGNAFGLLSGARTDIEVFVRQKVESALATMDMVPRDEFEAVKAMAIRARVENETLTERVTALEEKIQMLQNDSSPSDKDAPS